MTKEAQQPVENMVQSMRLIRDEINIEIKDMTYAEERDFLDNALNNKKPVSAQKKIKNKPFATNSGL